MSQRSSLTQSAHFVRQALTAYTRQLAGLLRVRRERPRRSRAAEQRDELAPWELR
jgi:hypothetical protein